MKIVWGQVKSHLKYILKQIKARLQVRYFFNTSQNYQDY